MARRVAIVGFAESYAQAPFEDAGVEIWGLNELHKYLPRWDRWFELHGRETFGFGGDRNQEQHVAWLRSQPGVGQPGFRPIFMREAFADIPACVPYPLEAMSERFWGQGTPYWASSIGFMLALAIAEGRDAQLQPIDEGAVGWIGLYGIDLASDTEYADQRPNAEYFIGLARGLGIEVAIAPGAALLRHDHIYGFEDRLQKEGPNGEAFLLKRIQEIEEQRNKTICTLNTLDGMKDECVFHLKRLQHARRGVQL